VLLPCPLLRRLSRVPPVEQHLHRQWRNQSGIMSEMVIQMDGHMFGLTNTRRGEMNQQRWFGKAGSAFVASACLAAAAPVFGQAEQTTVFVSNNGNLRGGVTSFFIDSDGSLIHPQYLETGQRDSLSDPCPGCNAYSMAIS